jgi:acyl carrier protein
MNPIQQELHSFIVENFAVGGDVKAIGVDESLIQSGVVDSTGLLELVYFVESRYALHVPDQDLLPENFETIANISAYVTARTQRDDVTSSPQ